MSTLVGIRISLRHSPYKSPVSDSIGIHLGLRRSPSRSQSRYPSVSVSVSSVGLRIGLRRSPYKSSSRSLSVSILVSVGLRHGFSLGIHRYLSRFPCIGSPSSASQS
ncbi:hypothetical protein BDD12DRAFT_877932 [Trichophaea hybrida]|nr:hypothetical protein BDD12DRAFT_877932 [Trichophaea hybrida]